MLDWLADLVAHVSGLVHRVATLTGHGSDRDEGEELPENVVNIMALGRLWEYLVRRAVRVWGMEAGYWFDSQVAVECEGVIGSLDGMLYLPVEGEQVPQIVVECKCRFAQPRDPRDNFRWMAQVKAYCYMLGVNKAWMPVLYLPRNFPPDARFINHELEFEQWELEENWTMLVNAR
jgi:hypothetical protein